MKRKDYSSANKNEKKVDPELIRFQKLSIQLVAGKILHDYIMAHTHCVGEPEYFFEEWLKVNIIKADEEFKQVVWTCFMEILMTYRRFEKFQ